jgi:O-antigen ligase
MSPLTPTTVEDYASLKAEFGLIWLVYGCAVVTGLTLLVRPELAMAAAMLAVVALAAYHLPELVLVLFLVVGPLRTSEVGVRAQGAITAVDLTVAAAAALALAVGVSLWRHRAEPFSVPAPAVFFLGLCALLLVGVLHSPAPADGLDKAVAFQLFSALAFLAPLAIVRTRAALVRTLGLLVAVAVAVALTAEEAERSESVLVLPGGNSQIQVGLLLGLGLVAIVAYLWPASRGWARLVWLPPAALVLPKLLSAGGRSALLGSLLACAVAMACLVGSGRRNRIAALALVGVLAALLPAAWATSSPAAKERYLVTVLDVRGGAGLDAGGAERADLASAAVGVFADHPLGAGTAGYTALTGYEWPHNIVLELAAELGLAGVAVFLALLAGTAVALRRAALDPRLRLEAIGAASLIVLPLTMSFSSFDLNGNRILWFACGLGLAVTRLRS